MLFVDEKLCPQDHACPCVKVCPVNAIEQEGYSLPIIKKEVCVFCQKCFLFCPKGAIRKEVSC